MKPWVIRDLSSSKPAVGKTVPKLVKPAGLISPWVIRITSGLWWAEAQCCFRSPVGDGPENGELPLSPSSSHLVFARAGHESLYAFSFLYPFENIIMCFTVHFLKCCEMDFRIWEGAWEYYGVSDRNKFVDTFTDPSLERRDQREADKCLTGILGGGEWGKPKPKLDL